MYTTHDIKITGILDCLRESIDIADNVGETRDESISGAIRSVRSSEQYDSATIAESIACAIRYGIISESEGEL